MMKRIVESTLFMKSSYNFVPVTLIYHINPVKGIIYTRESVLFEIRSFVQQNVASILNEPINEWRIDFFSNCLGMSESRETYRCQIALIDSDGRTRKLP